MGDEPAVYEEDGKVIYRASQLGKCLTMLAAARQSQDRRDPPKVVEQAYERGNEAERRFNSIYPNYLKNRQLQVELDITPTIKVRCHIDGTWNGPLENGHQVIKVGEIKSQSDLEYEKGWQWETPLWQSYLWQISPAMIAMGIQGLFIRVKASEPETFETHPMIVPPHSQEQILSRILLVEALAADDELLCTTPTFFCDYPYLHPTDTLIEDDEMEVYVKAYLEEQQKGKDSATVLANIRGKLRDKLLEHDSNKVILASGNRVSYSEYDVKEHVVKASHQSRLTVTARQEPKPKKKEGE